jgi:hypothetical protein
MGVNDRIEWPDGREFAFTVFDDPDAQSYETTRIVYSFLADIGLRTTVAVWPLGVRREVNSGGETCANPEYRQFLSELQTRGFEIAFHHAFPHSARREETIEALDTFRQYFGAFPRSMANHYNEEAIYWGSARVGGWRRFLYNLTTRWKNEGRFFGHVPGHRAFWGDICHERIQYCRNFVFSDINTLAATPFMPYSDPVRPYVNEWFSSSEGHQAPSFIKTLSERNQDKLQAERGASIMYTHFGHGFVRNGQLNPEFRRLMERIAKKPGWFVPVSTLLEFLKAKNGTTVLDGRVRRSLETRWLWEKLFRGTS